MKSKAAQPTLGQSRPSLGSMIRAARLGFHWSAANRAFVRLSGGKAGDPFRCELRSCELIPNSAKSDRPFWVYWVDGGALETLAGIKALRNIRRVKREFCFYFNDNGETV